MSGFRCRLALTGAAMLLAGAVLSGTHVTAAAGESAGAGPSGRGGAAVLESAAVATVPAVGRARSWGEVESGRGDQLVRAPLVAILTGVGLLLPLAGALWWLARPDRRVASPQRAVTSAASRAPPVAA
jgi:hypothetical protein